MMLEDGLRDLEDFEKEIGEVKKQGKDKIKYNGFMDKLYGGIGRMKQRNLTEKIRDYFILYFGL